MHVDGSYLRYYSERGRAFPLKTLLPVNFLRYFVLLFISVRSLIPWSLANSNRFLLGLYFSHVLFLFKRVIISIATEL